MSEDIIAASYGDVTEIADHVVLAIGPGAVETSWRVNGADRAAACARALQAARPKAQVRIVPIRPALDRDVECGCADTGIRRFDEYAHELPQPVPCWDCRPLVYARHQARCGA